MKTVLHFSALDRKTLNSVTNVKKDEVHRGCHNLSQLYEDKTQTSDPTWRKWVYEMTACHPSSFLYGPACLREGHILIYPCQRMQCVIRCPCRVCMDHVHQDSGHSLQDDFQDHKQYHSAPHMTCIFCTEILRLLPGFNFRKVIFCDPGQPFPAPSILVLKKAYAFEHIYIDPDTVPKNRLKCEECGLCFKKSCNRERHVRNVHYQQKYECRECGKLFGRADNLKKHTKVHQGLGKNITADETESSDEDLELMGELSDVDKDIDDTNSGCDSPDSNKVTIIKCEKCDKEFSKNYNLKVHMRKKKDSCQECKDYFCSKSALSAHLKAHHGTKDFECSACGKEFSAKHSLKRHSENSSMNACVSCNYVSCNAYDLKTHVYTNHTCKKCTICGEKYDTLNHHMETVHGSSSRTK